MFTFDIKSNHSVTKFGLFNPWLFLGGVLSAVSGGILSTFTVGTSSSMINGILAMSGMGMALLIQTVSATSTIIILIN